MNNYQIAVLAGDGIGPEVMEQAVRIVDAAGRKFGFAATWRPMDVGGADRKSTRLNSSH